jgi:hypothetical protein
LKTSSRHDSPNRDWYGLNDRDYEHKKWKVFFMKGTIIILSTLI